MTIKQKARDWFRIEPRAAVDEITSADVFIYDEIGESFWGGGVSASSMAVELAALDVDNLAVYINSPGGAAWDGIAIMNAIRRHRAFVTVHIDGLAASAASIIAMAGDKVIMNRGSQLMIHDASGGVYGNATDMEETAAILQKLADSLADVYAGRTGTDRAEWRDAMKAETWYTAEEAVAAGLADEWSDIPASQPVDRARFSARARTAIPSLASLDLPSSSKPGTPNRKEPLIVSETLLKAGLRERLGITDSATTDDQLLAAVDVVLDQATAPSPTVPAGTVLIDSAVLSDLQANAALGRQAHESQVAARRTAIVDSAVADGRIARPVADQPRRERRGHHCRHRLAGEEHRPGDRDRHRRRTDRRIQPLRRRVGHRHEGGLTMADYLPKFSAGKSVTFNTSTAVVGGRLVAVTGDLTVGPAGADSAAVVGVASVDTIVGDAVTVYTRPSGVQRLVASGAIAAGAKVISAAAGKIATQGAGVNPIGIALEAATADLDVIDVLFI
ncbi:head maturation protease, ClpP-related [Cryobacterium sp. Y57]|uniref:head maturation protease, ClpP-related n=1 Tax=Cryobacterium sp. Y57 TaxID=2048287 RepID=UPI000CE42668|nr:head maturation protease, ClpP-related [Cryobacterium sp. Y57]